MRISSATFAGSSSSAQGRPPRALPEFAFIGRSNVGKSSLINSLCRRSSLAKTSATPGKTRLINRFLINDNWYLVDLPGYGYAKISLPEREKLYAMIDGYIRHGEALQTLFVLVDSRHELQKIDLDFMHRLGEEGIPFAIVFTKGDKLGPVALQRRIEEAKARLSEDWEELPTMISTSSKTGKGTEELLDYIESILTETQQ